MATVAVINFDAQKRTQLVGAGLVCNVPARRLTACATIEPGVAFADAALLAEIDALDLDNPRRVAVSQFERLTLELSPTGEHTAATKGALAAATAARPAGRWEVL